MLAVQSEPFGEVDGQPITQYLLSNKNGLAVSIIDYGAIVTSVVTSDKDGRRENITLGFADLEGYLGKDPYFGAICGRYANRIARGKFSIGDEQYELAINNEPNHLHGGTKGFNEVVWQARPLSNEMTEGEAVGVELKYHSPDGEEGYPGALDVTVTYTLDNDDRLRIDYEAVTDKPTVLNLTNHCYWNLAGVPPDGRREGLPTMLDHELMLNADHYLPVDETLIPTGELKPVAGTPFDFTEPHKIGERIGVLKAGVENGGYDHCYALNGQPGELKLAARVVHPESGRTMQVQTTEPGVQFYTGNFLDGSEANGGFEQHQGFCLECQHYPNSPNEKRFPETLLKPGEVYRQTTIHQFGVQLPGAGGAVKVSN
ncbi:MAG: galactose mutarotase [Planctomycetes bacterium]|nr:galactose mutarotase [Planctomycetota bacterium]